MAMFAAFTAGCSSKDADVGGGAGSGDAGEFKERTFKIGHIRPENSDADNNVKFFKEELSKNSDGKMNLEIYPASQLGGIIQWFRSVFL